VVLGCTQTRAQAAEIARRLREAGAEARLETEGT
jgi:hypothetical protein